MTALDRFVPTPRLREVDSIEVGVPVDVAFRALDQLDLGALPLARALFSLRTAPGRAAGGEAAPVLGIQALKHATHGFRLLDEVPGSSLTFGAIGRVWEADIPFVDVDGERFAAYAEPGWVKVAWELRATPVTAHGAEVAVEVRVDATDEPTWRRFRRYFALIGPFSRLIRKMMLHRVARELGTPDRAEATMPLPGDEIVPRPMAMHTDAITIAAPPSRVWPWLVQMGGDRGGWYAHDLLDNGGVPSAREIDPMLQHLARGDVIHALPGRTDGFTVLEIEPERALVLGGATDLEADRPVAIEGPMPASFWRSTWAFALEPIGSTATRLLVRVRGDWAPGRLVWRARIALLVHHFMEHEQLRSLQRRAEGRLARDTKSDVIEGVEGAARIVAAMATPFLRPERSHWGLDPELAARVHPGDDLVPDPCWSWTHGIEVDAPPERVWPWVAQIGRDRAGFYSYQFLENLARCDLTNADRVHDEWVRAPSSVAPMVLHPSMPPIPIARIEPGHFFVAHAPQLDGDPNEASVSWLFLVEPIGGGRSRIVSRFRSRHADRLATRLAMGPTITEPIGFAMDRRMLLGIKARAERR